MVSRRLPPLVAIVSFYLISVLAPVALAQTQGVDQTPAHIEFVEGTATLEREGQADLAAPGAPFIPGDRIRTDGGRVEVLFPDGTALAIDQFTALDLQSPTLMRATRGRLILTVAGANNPAASVRYQIDTPVASANTDSPGEFRIAILSAPA